MSRIINYKIFAILAFICIQCSGDKNPSLIKININDTKKLTSYYYRDNLENISHFDSINFVWSSKEMLGNNFTLKPIEEYGQVALFSPKVQGTYKVELNIEHRWTGKILNTEYYDIIASENISNQINSSDYSKKETILKSAKQEKVKEFNKVSYSVQVSSWKKEEDALKEKKVLEKLGYSPYIENFKNNKQNWWRVRLGPYSSKSEAARISNKLNENLNRDCWIDLNGRKSKSYTGKQETKKEIEIENLIDYEDEITQKNEIEIENLIDYEDEITQKKDKYYIQISTWTNKQEADIEVKKIKALGYKPFILEDYDKNNQLWHKVRIGPLSNQESINLKYKISKDLGKNVWVDKK